MFYQRSFTIERRLEEVLRLIRSGSHSTPSLAAELGISIPTVSRSLTALRERGHDIRPERGPDGWHYVLVEQETSNGPPQPSERGYAQHAPA
jgi:biotin operon repressor